LRLENVLLTVIRSDQWWAAYGTCARPL